jgi:hypothetical protein
VNRLFIVLVLGCSAFVPAQRTYRVDSAGTGNFTSIPQALASPLVTHGDTLLVTQGGPYDVSTTTDKGVRILGERGNFAVRGTLRVAVLPASETFGLVASSALAGGFSLEFVNCDGRVLVDGAYQGQFDPLPPSYVSIDNCAHVSINDSALIDVRAVNGRFVRITRSSSPSR